MPLELPAGDHLHDHLVQERAQKRDEGGRSVLDVLGRFPDVAGGRDLRILRCVCGETFTTGSTKKELKVEICSKCHPFYTGKQKLVDTGGRVDKFKKRYGDLLNK